MLIPDAECGLKLRDNFYKVLGITDHTNLYLH